MCLCEDSRPNGSLSISYSQSVYPGELFDVFAGVVGDMQGLVSTFVQASVLPPNIIQNMLNLVTINISTVSKVGIVQN